MGMVLQSIKSIFALLILIGMGFYFAGKKWFGKNGMDFLSKFTVEATLPFYMFYNIYRDLESRERLLFLITKVPYVFALILMCVCLAAVTAKVCRIREDRRDTFIVAAGFPNVVFIGFPVIQALWGEGITSVGAIYYICEHSPLLDAGDQSAAAGRKKRQECEMGAEYQKSVLPDGRRNVSWNGSSLFQDRSP